MADGGISVQIRWRTSPAGAAADQGRRSSTHGLLPSAPGAATPERHDVVQPIQGKVILITGASSGIAEATVRHLAGTGASVMLGAWRTDRLDRPAAELAADGGTARARALNVTSRQDCAAFARAALEAFGRIDVIVNNAGVMPLVYDAFERTGWLDLLRDAVEAGDVRLRVAEEYAMDQVAAAHRSLEAGGLRGRPVINV